MSTGHLERPKKLWTNRNLAVVLVGLFCGVKLNVLGEFYLGEVFAVCALPLVVASRGLRREDLYTAVATMLWSVAQLVSDLFNDTSIESSIKGVVAPLVFGATVVVAAHMLRGHRQRVGFLLLGIALADLARLAGAPTEYQQYEPWKWGYGPLICGLVAVWLSFFRRSGVVAIGLFAIIFAAVSFLENARSLAAIPLLACGAFAFWRSSKLKRVQSFLRGRCSPVRIAVPIMAAAVILNLVFSTLFASGEADKYLGSEAAQKYRQQATSSVGLLVAGRSESLISIKAFLDSPIVGHGSWPQDKVGYIAEYAALRFQLGITDDVIESNSSLIPTHSFLFGALVWCGVAGGLAWLMISYRLLRTYSESARELPIYFHIGVVAFVWNLLFSPFGADARWATAIFLAAVFSYRSSEPSGRK